MKFEEWLDTQKSKPIFIACSDEVIEAARLGWEAAHEVCEDIVRRARELAVSEAGKHEISESNLSSLRNRINELESMPSFRTDVKEKTVGECEYCGDNMAHSEEDGWYCVNADCPSQSGISSMVNERPKCNCGEQMYPDGRIEKKMNLAKETYCSLSTC